MKTFLTTILCLIVGIMALSAQSKRALIIGIGDYPPESGWAEINGDRDVEIVRDMLLRLDYKSENITELVNERATKSNIIAQLETLAKDATKGDTIYIHFSGHGQRVTDLDGDESSADKLDESIIPYDAQKQYVAGVYEGENHIIDDELNTHLARIANKIGNDGEFFVVLDACHSGDGTRREDIELPARGVYSNFEIPESAQMHTEKSHSPRKWVEVSACKNYQVNFECRVGDDLYGSLSYAIYDLVTQSEREVYDITEAELSEKIGDLRREHDIPQNPTITTPSN